jgi:uncharacterized paraquat-inducible protein A
MQTIIYTCPECNCLQPADNAAVCPRCGERMRAAEIQEQPTAHQNIKRVELLTQVMKARTQ